MREMILNHASVAAAGRHEATAWLADVVNGMKSLVLSRVVSQKTLRMYRPLYEIGCPGEWSLYDVSRELQKQGKVEEFRFFVRLAYKVPLLSDVDSDVKNRFLACETTECETKTLPPEDGAPLVLCAITGGVAVGFPSEPIWDRDRITVAFRELLPDDTFKEADEEIDHLARPAHAGPITARHLRHLRSRIETPADIWSQRAAAFPHLTFGPDVKEQLGRLNAGWLTTVVNRLADLDATAVAWGKAAGTADPPWTCKVTPESDKLMQHPKLREARRFRSVGGERLLFEWHARYGDGGRIHLRFDARTREIEIGYVGLHLPRPTRAR